jgi:hypothetical protein
MMRYLLLSVIIVFSFIACRQSVKGENGVNYKSAVQYNDYIINRQTRLVKQVLDINRIADLSIDSAELILTQSSNDAKKMIAEIQGMPAYKGDSALRDAAAKMFIFYIDLFENDYMDIFHILKKGKENISADDKEEFNRIIESINKKEEGLEKAFHHAQKNFAEKNRMKLIQNKAQQDIE